MRIIYTGAHGGFDTSRIPLGGGAAVMDALVKEWSRTRPFELTVLGIGDGYDLPGVEYVRLPIALPKRLTDLSEREYGRVCREFERAATEWVKRNGRPTEAASHIVLSNDISEGPNFREVAALGLPIATIFHVDVVEYVSKFYCRGWLKPEWLASLQRGLETLRLARFVPDVVRLIFEKQADCVRHSTKLIVPSRGMADVLRRCYPDCDAKIEVIPWGVVEPPVESLPRDPRFAFTAPKVEFEVSDDELVLLTLCRISPEKGIDRLLEALHAMESTVGAASAPRLRWFICGAPAFMQGQAYLAKLHRFASRLPRIRVHFVGHVSGERKRAFFELADLYVHLSYHESYGLTIAEAMRAGCPVLTTNHHSARDLVPPECGCIVSGRREETVAALMELLADRERLAAMGLAAAEHGNKLNFSTSAARLADVLKQMHAPVAGVATS